jgi:hypothetical protein
LNQTKKAIPALVGEDQVEKNKTLSAELLQSIAEKLQTLLQAGA